MDSNIYDLFFLNLHRENSDSYFKQTIPYPYG